MRIRKKRRNRYEIVGDIKGLPTVVAINPLTKTVTLPAIHTISPVCVTPHLPLPGVHATDGNCRFCPIIPTETKQSASPPT